MKRVEKMIILIILGIFILIFTVFMIYVNTNINVVEETLEYKKLPPGFDDYKIVLISDLHDKKFSARNRLLLNIIKEQNPNIVVMAGDMHDYKNLSTTFYEFCEDLSSICPTYFVEGNHDNNPYQKHPQYFAEFQSELAKAGVVNLRRNKAPLIAENGDEIYLYGYSWHEYGPYIPPFEEDEFNIFLFHNPLIYDDMEQTPDLMLCGHVHGGFIDLPFFGPLVSPSGGRSVLGPLNNKFFFPKYAKGVYENEKDEKKLVVSKGLGSSGVFFRMMSSEVVVVRLKSNE